MTTKRSRESSRRVGRAARKNQTGIFDPKNRGVGGKVAGRMAVTNRTGIFDTKHIGKGGRVAGKIQGDRNVANGHMEKIQYLARHRRWHTLGSFHWRGMWIPPAPKKWCSLCKLEGLV